MHHPVFKSCCSPVEAQVDAEHSSAGQVLCSTWFLTIAQVVAFPHPTFNVVATSPSLPQSYQSPSPGVTKNVVVCESHTMCPHIYTHKYKSECQAAHRFCYTRCTVSSSGKCVAAQCSPKLGWMQWHDGRLECAMLLHSMLHCLN